MNMKQLIEDLKKQGIGAAMVARATGISSAKFYNVLNDRATRFDTTEVEAVAKFRLQMLDASSAGKG